MCCAPILCNRTHSRQPTQSLARDPLRPELFDPQLLDLKLFVPQLFDPQPLAFQLTTPLPPPPWQRR